MLDWLIVGFTCGLRECCFVWISGDTLWIRFVCLGCVDIDFCCSMTVNFGYFVIVLVIWCLLVICFGVKV